MLIFVRFLFNYVYNITAKAKKKSNIPESHGNPTKRVRIILSGVQLTVGMPL